VPLAPRLRAAVAGGGLRSRPPGGSRLGPPRGLRPLGGYPLLGRAGPGRLRCRRVRNAFGSPPAGPILPLARFPRPAAAGPLVPVRGAAHGTAAHRRPAATRPD